MGCGASAGKKQEAGQPASPAEPKKEEPKKEEPELTGENAAKFQEMKFWVDFKARATEMMGDKTWMYWPQIIDETCEKEMVPNIESFNKSKALGEKLKKVHSDLALLVPDKLKKEAIEHFAWLACLHAVEEANAWPLSPDPYYSVFMDTNGLADVKALWEKAIALAEEKKFEDGAEILVMPQDQLEHLARMRFPDNDQEITHQIAKSKVESMEQKKVVAAQLENQMDIVKGYATGNWDIPAPFFGFRATCKECSWRCVRIAGGTWHIAPTI